MYDRFNRHISYVRISVTDRCNLRCSYCMPAEGVACKPHEQILSFDEIVGFVNAVVPLGITKVRLTGGEPLVRKGIVDLVAMLSQVPGITDLAMTTNGTKLTELAPLIKQAGLGRLNISLDTLDPVKFEDLTRGGDLQAVLDGIFSAKSAGFETIKINSVYFAGSTLADKFRLEAFCKEHGLALRFIHQMNLKTGEFSVVEGGEGGNCGQCNRIRLTADGFVKPCLFSDQAYSIRELGVLSAVEKAISAKPRCGSKSNALGFYAIGG